jgi:superfamily II DNA or RNA helicase
MQYYADSSPEKKEMVLQYFENNPSIIVSIRCLDEGANIPAADGAIILASSSNPRQYIQRRGRVLRTAKGKRFATIVDVLVLPREEDHQVPFSIVKGELARAWSFAKNAQNKEISHDLRKPCLEYSVNIEEDAKMGVEE